jgi:hypothetical protein
MFAGFKVKRREMRPSKEALTSASTTRRGRCSAPSRRFVISPTTHQPQLDCGTRLMAGVATAMPQRYIQPSSLCTNASSRLLRLWLCIIHLVPFTRLDSLAEDIQPTHQLTVEYDLRESYVTRSASARRIGNDECSLTWPIVDLLETLPHILVAQNVEPSKLDPLLAKETDGLTGEPTLGRRRVTLHEKHDLVLVHELFASGGDLLLGALTGSRGGRRGGVGARGGERSRGRGGRGVRVLGEEGVKEGGIGTGMSGEEGVALDGERYIVRRSSSDEVTRASKKIQWQAQRGVQLEIKGETKVRVHGAASRRQSRRYRYRYRCRRQCHR